MDQYYRCLALIALLAVIIAAPAPALACSACGCTLNSDWASEGLAASGGWRFDARFDYFNQQQLRSGTDTVDRTALQLPNEREIQQYTLNRNYNFTLDYSRRNWGVSVSLPWYDRSHATIAGGDTDVSTSHDQGVGDLRVLVRYAGFDPQHQTGIEVGLKLPTGQFTTDFTSGPQAGERLDRGLQLGTGTTDLLIGAYHFGALSSDWGYFSQILFTVPMGSRESFRPGTGVNFNIGTRYTASSTWMPQLQLNVRSEKRESGSNADVPNSGATLVYLSPGITWNLARRMSAYLFTQVPIYQRVNGLQIEATRFTSVGLQYKF